MSFTTIDYAFSGCLREDYFITADNATHHRVIGGNALYAAVGARVWVPVVGVLARVGSNYPREWLEKIQRHDIDTQGVKVLPGFYDTRTFYAYLTPEERVDTDPAAHYARVGQSLPPGLADYMTSTEGQESRTQFAPLAVRPTDIPQSYYQHLRGVHLSPADFMTHNSLPAILRRRGVRYVTCDPSIRYMHPSWMSETQALVRGLDAFLPSAMEVSGLFRETITDMWAAAEALGAMGVKIVVIKLGAQGQYVYVSANRRRWHIPAYPATVRDVTGCGDAFCGGFLVGLTLTDDPLEAALRGAISASLVLEGVGALYALDSSRALANARLESLRNAVRVI